MAETRASRYISSSDGIQMQAQATQTIAESTARGVAKVQQGQQQYFEGLVQNNNNVAALQQQLAQVELAGASRPSSLQQLGQGIIQGLGAEKERQDQRNAQAKAAAAAKAKLDAENLKNTQLTKYGAALGDLTDAYASRNWDRGIEQYKVDATEILKNLPPNTDPEVAKALFQQVHENSLGRARQIGDNLQKDTDELRRGEVDKARSNLMYKLNPVVNSIASQSLDEQASPFIGQASNIVTDFMNTDNGLTRGAKLSIVASAMDAVNSSYGKKHARYLERTAQLQDWNAYAVAYKELEAKEAVGLIGFDEMRNGMAALDFRYPGFAEKIVKRGEEEERNLATLRTVEGIRELKEKAGARAIANYQFNKGTVGSMIAAAFSDPAFKSRLKNDPQLKDNLQFQEAIAGADKLSEYFNDKNQIVIAQAEAATAFQRLDLSTVQDINNINLSIARKLTAGQTLSPTEQMAQVFINQYKAANPDLAATLELGAQGKPIPQIDQAAINAALQREAGVRENIKQGILQEIEAKKAALYEKYPDLLNYGFLGQTQDAIRALAKNATPALNKELENIQRLQQEAIQQAEPSSQYGIQPNFNPSSAYATSVDGNGKVKVVPRARAQLMRLPDSSSIVTPIIAGASAPVTSNYLDSRPGGRKHAGTDFGASNGARAIALVPGQVVYVGNDPSGYGGYVDLLGDNGVVYRYGHQAAQVKVGQRVNAGDVVSVSDGSGAGAPHLHFEVRPHPVFANGKYDVTKNFGVPGTVNAIDHLRQLTAKNSNVLTPRFNSSAYRTAPQMKVPGNSTLSNRGGAVNGATYQRVGGTPGGVSNRISSQRPLAHSQAPYKVNVGKVQQDYNDNLGYAELAKDSNLRKAFVDTAKTLGVPTAWIVDIARQESGGINPYKDHDGNHYGLFGFGSDSLSDNSQYQKLRAGKVDGAGQLKMYVSYLKENGWDKVVKQKNGAVTIADLWAFTRYGWNARQKFWNTGDVNMKTNGGLTYKDELQLLGKWAGRSYTLPGSRSLRSSAVSEEESAYCPLCAQLAASGSYAPHAHIT